MLDLPMPWAFFEELHTTRLTQELASSGRHTRPEIFGKSITSAVCLLYPLLSSILMGLFTTVKAHLRYYDTERLRSRCRDVQCSQ